ncbi:YopX family protein [Bacillus halotolerans]|uniref:YopX family protein n=1 Tax=Bacillus halotolerans TaxID=260554 RepID=UPI002DBFEE94|nr:YopX family protein [Bacillus halotolerans]MEC1600695.1 YopX family protein [Bacillus halotolerans]
MREIKFRAWHEKWNRLIYEIYLGDNEVKFPIGNTNDILDINEEYSNLIFQQYTGLKDKNGRDIYEGDIVIDGRKNSAEVVFDDGCFCVIGYLGDLRTHPLRDSLFCGERFEVIGNIYEDPELQEASHASK